MEYGAVIVSAGLSSRMNDFKPMMKIESISIIEKVILTLRQAGVKKIVVVTGFQAEKLESHILKYNVICLYNENYKNREMFDSAKIGLQYLMDKCNKILFTPVDIPLFSVQTVNKLLKSKSLLAKPVCKGKGGHPILIDSNIIPLILDYKGDGGLKNALVYTGAKIDNIIVDDNGTLMDADTQEDFRELLKYYYEKK